MPFRVQSTRRTKTHFPRVYAFHTGRESMIYLAIGRTAQRTIESRTRRERLLHNLLQHLPVVCVTFYDRTDNNGGHRIIRMTYGRSS